MAKAKAKSNEAAAPVSTNSEYTVVARRYRPQQFTDLVGQEAVARALMNAISSNRIAHAYLFTGVRGTGKTSTARILAKALNCAKGPTPTPCDQCEICLGIASGEDIDVQEIDGASNRGIDEIRALRQNVGTRPSRSRFKIYIIDEVHMLSTPAFNALLKTLEEPPAHVKFIFATTDAQKLPLTILSRCQRFDFGGISSAKIAERLKEVVQAEGMQAEDDALLFIARRAGGSMRDAQSLLEQLLSFDGEKLTLAKIQQMLGAASNERMLALVDAIAAKDAKQAIELLTRDVEEGLQLGEMLDQLIEYWRSLMLLNCAGEGFADISLNDENRKKAVRHAQSLTLDTILAGLDVLTATKSRFRGSNHGQVLLEMAIVRLIRIDDLIPLAQLAQLAGQSGGASMAVSPKPASARNIEPPAPAKKNSLAETDSAVPASPAVDLGNVASLWGRLRDSIGPFLAGNLDAAGLPAIFGPNALVLRFPARYTSQYAYCTDPSNLDEIQKTIKAIAGPDWFVKIEKDSVGETVGAPTEAKTQPAKAVTFRERNEETLQIPLISRAADKLGARLLKVDEGFGVEPPSPVESENSDPQE